MNQQVGPAAQMHCTQVTPYNNRYSIDTHKGLIWCHMRQQDCLHVHTSVAQSIKQFQIKAAVC